MRRCFQNAHAWRTRCDDLVRVGSMDANTLAIAVSDSGQKMNLNLTWSPRRRRGDAASPRRRRHGRRRVHASREGAAAVSRQRRSPQAEITNSADILLIVLDAALRQERSDFKPIAPAKREASPARLTTPKKVKGQPSPTSPKPFWRLQAERLWSKITKHEWVRNDGLQSYGGKLQWFRPTVGDSASSLNFKLRRRRRRDAATPSS